MNKTQAKRLLPQTIVMLDGNPEQRGIVTDVVLTGFYVTWTRDSWGFYNFANAEHVSMWEPEAKP